MSAGDRVYDDRTGATELVVAASPGLVVVAVSGGRVGEFGVARRCVPADVAIGRGTSGGGPGVGVRVAVATDDDVLLGRESDLDAVEPSGFGEAVAVTFDGDRPVAAGPDGRLAVYEGGAWTTVAALPSAPAALDGDLAGTAEGVYRLDDGGLQPAGLSAVNDVARQAGVPLAATADGLFELGNGWLDVLDGDVQVVAGATDGRAHAATGEACFERTDAGWRTVDLPTDAAVAAVAYGGPTYALAADGDLLVGTTDGWRAEPLGIEDPRAAVVV